ncbi:hypothetical protein CTM93_06680 [Photobacterium phosphoreum]|uniref:DUF4145 domain-containing protein n=1 Tax=Photobacterium phosphoreum TaxID=659 RepID=UPI000D183998|nr:DUF4145 domain-containing protein [Photobacterium phosphoreum]PSU84862.1 hypothetical protein CTM93_06680 [Photobacterium phosphoreum]
MTADTYFDYINKRFKVSFTETSMPSILCPHCSKGEIKLQKETFAFEENPDSKAMHNHPEWEPDWIEYRYAASFVCSNCNGKTYSCGTGGHFVHHPCHPDDEYADFPIFYPKYFEPSISLFKVHEKCPQNVKELLNLSFSLAWVDVSASANKLRIAIETLLNSLEPELAEIKALHNRIESFGKQQPEVAQLLMAIKWLGNEASHDATLKEYDLAFAFEVMELSINKLYDDSEEKIKQMVEMVNSNKGKPFKSW